MSLCRELCVKRSSFSGTEQILFMAFIYCVFILNIWLVSDSYSAFLFLFCHLQTFRHNHILFKKCKRKWKDSQSPFYNSYWVNVAETMKTKSGFSRGPKKMLCIAELLIICIIHTAIQRIRIKIYFWIKYWNWKRYRKHIG